MAAMRYALYIAKRENRSIQVVPESVEVITVFDARLAINVVPSELIACILTAEPGIFDHVAPKSSDLYKPVGDVEGDAKYLISANNFDPSLLENVWNEYQLFAGPTAVHVFP